MKIDIGSGKILGTKRVSPNGQISGFTEYAGREVIVVLPEGEPSVQLDAKEYLKELQTASNEHMKLLFEQYKELKKKFDTPQEATKDFMGKYAPKSFQGLYEKVEAWTKETLGKAELRVEKALHREEGEPPSLEAREQPVPAEATKAE